jgi:hypothetical protein
MTLKYQFRFGALDFYKPVFALPQQKTNRVAQSSRHPGSSLHQ